MTDLVSQLVGALEEARDLLEKKSAERGHGCSYTARECHPAVFERLDAALTAAKAGGWGAVPGADFAPLQPQPAAPGVTGAVQTLIETLKADPEYAWAWHCNVAVAAVDEGLSHYAANKAAARFLSWLAQIDTTTHPGFPQAPAQPAAAVSDEEINRIVWEHTRLNPNQAADSGLMLCIRNAVRAILALRPQVVPMPEPVQRLSRYAGQTMRTARNPNITAREAIEIGDYLAAVGITAQGAQGGEAR